MNTIELSETIDHLKHLQQEREVLESMIEEHDTGHIKTAISVLSHRIEKLKADVLKDLDL
jgi:hypothetical protein